MLQRVCHALPFWAAAFPGLAPACTHVAHWYVLSHCSVFVVGGRARVSASMCGSQCTWRFLTEPNLPRTGSDSQGVALQTGMGSLRLNLISCHGSLFSKAFFPYNHTDLILRRDVLWHLANTATEFAQPLIGSQKLFHQASCSISCSSYLT